MFNIFICFYFTLRTCRSRCKVLKRRIERPTNNQVYACCISTNWILNFQLYIDKTSQFKEFIYSLPGRFGYPRKTCNYNCACAWARMWCKCIVWGGAVISDRLEGGDILYQTIWETRIFFRTNEWDFYLKINNPSQSIRQNNVIPWLDFLSIH